MRHNYGAVAPACSTLATVAQNSRKPKLSRAMSIAGVILILSGGVLGASGAPWWAVLIVIVVVLGAGYAIGARLQGRDDQRTARR